MEQVEVIMLLGVAGVGKDEVGLELIKNNFTRLSFAIAAKAELAKKNKYPSRIFNSARS
jgi:serine kinase of HPr protein (carbohydrate metabolism regulator)